MMQAAPTLNPYVGPRTFTYAQRCLFFGREREARDLLARVLSERLLLFYAQSGAGKSSLLHTRLIPRLQEEKGFVVLPVARVNGELPAGVERVDNLHVFNLLLSLDEGDDPGRLAQVTLSDFLARLTRRTLTDDAGQAHKGWFYDASLTPTAASPSGRRYALIIDQFEEIVTANPAHWREREDFFRQLDQALQDDPNLWVVLTLREDYVASLDPYAPLLADRLRARFYMERMDVTGALAAIRNPAAEFGRPFAPGVAEKLVDDLRQIRMAGQETTVLGQYVEPVQLQVVCYQLWERLTRGEAVEATGGQVETSDGAASDAATHPMITEADLAVAGDVDQSLEDFYTEALATVLNEPEIQPIGLGERALRTWFERELIIETGIRNTVFRNEAAGRTGSLPNAAVDALVGRFLLRTELRAGGAWLELIHDRFVQPIQTANREWFAQNRNPLTEWAAEWQQAGKPTAQLLRGERLQEARAQVESHPVDFSDLEREFVAASIATERRAVTRRWLSIGVIMILVVVVLFGVLVKTNSDLNRTSRYLKLSVAYLRSTIVESAPEQRALRSVASIQFAQKLNILQPPADLGQLVDTLASLGGLPLRAHQGVVNTVAFNPRCHPDAAGIAVDACRIGLASGGDDATLRLWDIRHPLPTSITLAGHSAAVKLIAFSPDGRWLASGGADHTMRLWDLTVTPPKPQVFSVAGDFTRLEFSPKGRWLVAATYDATVRLWDMSAEPQIAAPRSLKQAYGYAFNAVFSRDEQRLMTASTDGQRAGEVRLWRAADGFAQPEFTYPYGYIAMATLSPNGDWLAVSTDTLTELRYVGPEKTAPTDIVQQFSDFMYAYTMAFSADSRSFSTGSYLWRLNEAGRWSEPLRMVGQPQEGVSAPHFSRDGRWLASFSADYTAYRWDLADLTRLPYVYRGHEGGIHDLAFNADASLIATAGADGAVRLWRADAPTAGPVILHQPGEPVDVRMWDAAAADPSRSPRVLGPRPDCKDPTPFPYRLLAISPDGRYIALGCEAHANDVRLWDTTKPLAEPLELNHPGTVMTMKFGPTCTPSAAAGQCHSWLAVGEWRNDGTGNVRLWDMNNPTTDGFARLDLPHGAAVRDLAFSADGRLLVTGVGTPDSWDQYQVHVWPLDALTAGAAPATPARLLRGHTSIVRTVAVSASGRWVLSGAWDPDLTARLWDLNRSDGEATAVLKFKGRLFVSAFSPDERWAAAGSWDATAQLVRLDAPDAPPIVLAQHRGRILSMAISPDSHWLATGGEDRRIILWDLTAPDPSVAFAVVRSPTGSGFRVEVAFSADSRWLSAFGAAAFSRDASSLVTADNDVHLYNLQTDESIERICLAVGRTTDLEPNSPIENQPCPEQSENPLAKRLRAQVLRERALN